MPQTDYSTTRGVAIEGGLVDIADNTIESRVSTDVVDIPFGKPVKAETVASGVDKACLLAAASTDTVMGLAVYSNAYAKEEFGTSLKAGSMISVLRRGRIWVKAGVTVADGGRWRSTGRFSVAAQLSVYLFDDHTRPFDPHPHVLVVFEGEPLIGCDQRRNRDIPRIPSPYREHPAYTLTYHD